MGAGSPWRVLGIPSRLVENHLHLHRQHSLCHLGRRLCRICMGFVKTVEFAVKVLMIFIFTMINIRGVRDVGIVSSVLSILVIVAFTLVAICGFMNWEPGTFGPLTPEPAESLSDWFFYIGAAISIGMWMYSGYESMSTIAGEVKSTGHPQRNNDQYSPHCGSIHPAHHRRTWLLGYVGRLGNRGGFRRLCHGGNPFLGTCLRNILRHRCHLGTMFHLQYIYRIRIQRILCLGG